MNYYEAVKLYINLQHSYFMNSRVILASNQEKIFQNVTEKGTNTQCPKTQSTLMWSENELTKSTICKMTSYGSN